MNLGSGSTRQSSWLVSAGRAVATARIAGSVSLLGAEVGECDAAFDEDQLTRVAPASAVRCSPLPALVEARHAHEEAELLAERLAEALRLLYVAMTRATLQRVLSARRGLGTPTRLGKTCPGALPCRF